MFFTYVLVSEKDQIHYYGHSKNLDNRLRVHNNGKVRSTKNKIPWRVKYFEEYETKSEAYKREIFFKSIDGYRFLTGNNII